MTVPTPAIAPYVPTYATYIPYISPTEFLDANTGVDVSQLVPNGSELTQEQALLDLLARSSSKADEIARKPLAATTDVVAGEFLIRPDGTIRVPLPYKPVVAILSVKIGYTPNSLTAMTDLSGVFVGPKVARIPVRCAPGAAVFSRSPAAYATPGKIFAQVTYVNGWAHSTLADATLAGASSIVPATNVGFLPGLPVMVKDGPLTEAATVAPDYVYGSATVTFAAPLVNAHAIGTTVSALPPFVKDAVINIGRSLVKAKGSKAVVMGAIMGSINGQKVSGKTRTQNTEPGGDPDMAAAEKTLIRLRRAA